MRTLCLLLLTLAGPPLWAEQPVRIAVAANFSPTLTEINRLFAAESSHRVVLSSASTGVLASQIRHGAPFDLFFAADRATPEGLQDFLQASADDRFCYAVGSLVLVGADTLDVLADPAMSVAIANPETAPYGRAALDVLSRSEFRRGDNRRLVRGNNAAQAYQFWYSGGTELALVPRALVPRGGVPVPANWHRPLEQHVLVLRRSAAVDAYLDWFRRDTVRSLIAQAGYQMCP